MNHRGRTLLYWIGIAVVGSSCCGTGGCRFIHIPGYVTAWHNKISTEGLPVSTVDPVIDKTDQMTIKEMLDQQFPHSQISFREA